MAGLNLNKIGNNATHPTEGEGPSNRITPTTESNTGLVSQTEVESLAKSEEMNQKNPEAEISGARISVESEERFVYYTSAPIEKFGVGKYKFKDKQLKIPASEEEAFDAMIAKCDPRTRQIIKKIDSKRADAFVRALKPQASKQIDSASPENNARTLMGTRPIEDGSEI